MDTLTFRKNSRRLKTPQKKDVVRIEIIIK